MKIIFNEFIKQTNKVDKFIIILVFLFPLSLSISIFLSDLFASIMAIFVLFLVIGKKNREYFLQIKKFIYLFLAFYILILFSLFFSISFKDSFLPSFFYFRYFLFVLVIFYLLKKYSFMKSILLYSLSFTFLIIILDSAKQFFFLENFFNYKVNTLIGNTTFITSFFNEEKKLGSYLIRLSPFFLSLIFYFNKKRAATYFLFIIGILIFYTSERTALFLYLILLFSYFLVTKNKFKFFLIAIFFLSILMSFNDKLRYKYVTYSLKQFGLISTEWNKNYDGVIRYYSKEHEDLSYTALTIFRNNIFNGTGIKTFYRACNELKSKNYKKINKNFLERKNQLKCSTHPHNTYFQILSDTGVFAFIIISFIFITVLVQNFKILCQKDKKNIEICFYFLNLGIILNLFPLIPSGNFFNNWLSLILFYPLGFWLYINNEYKKT
tara:strand:+ start:115 stop:1425 length:1311 start_codon:yes stop_codon:yes gene_type:complete